MSDHSELKKLAEACGDLNWRAIQENWTELAIRDDHGYIATMRTKSGKHEGPCPDREAKAKFLCVVTPAAVLAMIAEVERLKVDLREQKDAKLGLSWAIGEIMGECDQLKVEIEMLRNLARELRGSAECTNVNHCKSEQHDLDEPCKVLARIDAAISKGAKP